MGEPCSTPLMWNSLCDKSAHELYNSPKSYNYQGRNPYDLDEESEENDGMDPRSRKKKQICPENPGYGAAGSDHRHDRMRSRQRMRVRSAYPAKKIEKDEPQMPKFVLDIIAEYPEIKHVPADMQQTSVHEHRGKYSKRSGDRLVRMEAQDVSWYRTIGQHYILAVSRRQELKDKERNVQGDNEKRHERKRPGGIVVLKRDQRSTCTS